MNIRTRLLVLILSILVPAFATGAMAVWFVYTEQKRAQEESLAEASRVLSQLIDNELESSEKFLQALAASPDLTSGNLKQFYEHIKRLSESGKNTIVLSSVDGQQLLNTRLPFGAAPRTINPRLLELRRLSDPYRTIASDLFFAPLGQRYDFAVQVPVIVDGTVRYYLSRGSEARELQRFLATRGFPSNWIASVTDRQGTLVARSTGFEQFVGKSATGSLAEKIRQKIKSGINEGTTLTGEPVKAFFHRAPMSEWTVVLSVPSSELDRPAMQASALMAVLIMLIFLAALLLTQRYLARILGPIQQLRNDAYRLGRGEVLAPHTSGVLELDEVSATMVQASRQIHESKAELERRVAEAIDSTERAQRALLQSQKLEALGRLTGGVAHDFNNVLQTLTSSLQLMRFESDPGKIPARIAMCEKAVARATALVAQMRAFGRTQEAYRETVQADQAVTSVLPMLESGLPSAIELKTRIAPAIWPITVDRTQLELALLNLVMNARDAIIDHGSITIAVCNHVQQASDGILQAGDYVRIDVADTGSGMPPDVLSKALDPFFTTKSVDKGSGLGLPQAYGFATQSRGTLVLESELGSGTTATLYLPREQTGSTAIAPSAIEFPDAEPRLSGTILFVEDDDLVRNSVTPMLQQAGARVLCARDSEEALQILESGAQVDVLFSDIVMPGQMNGLLLAKHVRQRFPRVAIVLATGYFNEDIDLQDVKILTKPYQVNDAIEMIGEAISLAPAEGA